MFSFLPRVFNDFLHAVQFLTRLPVGAWVRFDAGALGRSTLYFPAVGALVGLLTSAVLLMAASVFPPGVAVLLAMLAQVCLTGAMHEDGLADSADGLCGHAPRERALEIMRDSRIGVYGALALLFAFGLRFEFLRAMPTAVYAVCTLVAAGILSRAAAVFLLSTCASARADSPTSRPFHGGLPRPLLAWCLGVSCLVAVVFLRFQLAPLLLGIILTVLMRRFFLRRLGGITGDCIGATVVVVELAVLAGTVAR